MTLRAARHSLIALLVLLCAASTDQGLCLGSPLTLEVTVRTTPDLLDYPPRVPYRAILVDDVAGSEPVEYRVRLLDVRGQAGRDSPYVRFVIAYEPGFGQLLSRAVLSGVAFRHIGWVTAHTPQRQYPPAARRKHRR